MGTVKMKRLDVERYGRALNSLLEAVSGGLPPPEQLGRLLDGEERARCALPLMSEEALLDLTFDFDVELEDFFEPAAELRRAGLAREVVRLVQDARKSSGLDISDRIELWWSSADETVAQAMAEHAETIGGEVLAVSLTEGPGADDAYEVVSEEFGITLRLRKA